MKLGEPTLDQLRIFLAVEEEGSFGGAARRMGRAISAISYGIAQMEAQLGVTLFAREGSRKPELTDAGRGLLPEARKITDDVDALLAKTRSLQAGLESDVALALDVMVPGEVSAAVLREFRRMFPSVGLRLNIEALGAVELVPVAAPDHPLAAPNIAPGESRKHLQIVLSDRSPLTQGREFSVLSPETWRFADLGAKHALLKEGIGWGNMPRHMVREDLERGTLVELELPEKPGADYTLSAVWRRDARPGPATSWLIDALKEQLAQCPE